jgi:Holliday junction DNA helicase RuvB
MHEDEETLEMVYEPYLLRLGFIERSLRGRVLTAKGRDYLKS